MRPRRALLFMPGDDLRKIAKGAGLGVDSVIMDLEDAVALSRKDEARRVVVEALNSLDFGATERLIRLNAVSTRLTEVDLRSTVQARPDGYVLPKVESGAHIDMVCGILDVVERENGWPLRGIALLAIVETAAGVMHLGEIANAEPRLQALCFGAEDLAGDIGATRTRAGWEVFYARSAVVIAAVANGLQPIDTPFVNFNDLDGLVEDSQLAAEMGYAGKLAIHPRQIGPILAAFTPSPEAVAAAQRLVDAYRAHQASGTGVFALDGKMIDAPMLLAAERVLDRARRV